MILRVFKAVWFFSLLLLLGILMYVYASFAAEVSLGEGAPLLSKELIFYGLVLLVAMVNSTVFIVSKIYQREKEELTTWFHGLIITLNLFIIAILAYLSVVNSGEKYDYSRLGLLIYSSLGIVIAWAISWPVYSYSRKFFPKQQV